MSPRERILLEAREIREKLDLSPRLGDSVASNLCVHTCECNERLGYIDWLRGFACLAMFQVHCYDSWLSPAAHDIRLFMDGPGSAEYFPAPLFLFLAGVSVALVTDKMRRKGMRGESDRARRRSGEAGKSLALALLFRVQEFALGWPWSPWTDLLRVDILNTIGLSIVLMGAGLLDGTGTRRRTRLAAAVAAGESRWLTPPLWTTWRPRWLPWFLESYINGVHIFDKPQPWLFPIFPWAAFAFAGLAVGFLLFSDWADENPGINGGLVGRGRRGDLLRSPCGSMPRPCTFTRCTIIGTPAPIFSWRGWRFCWRCCSGLCLVPLGRGAVGIQPADSDGANFAAGLLGAHRVCLRATFDSEKGRADDSAATVGLLMIFAAMVLLSWRGRDGKGEAGNLWPGCGRANL